MYLVERWRLHSFDFALGLACMLAGKGKCVQCAVALEFFRAVAIFFVFFPEASAVQSGVGRCRVLSKCSFFVCQFNVSTVVIGFPVTCLYPPQNFYHPIITAGFSKPRLVFYKYRHLFKL
jgi:hypothetical protein